MTLQIEIILSENQIKALIRHSEQNAPNESCAILFGKTKTDQIQITEVFLTKNSENSPISFAISNQELIIAYNEAEKKSLDVSGIFHSHPSSVAYPSLKDIKYMEINPIPWIIFSNLNQEFKAYIYNSCIIPIPVKVL
jgi:proteasome lid subunit RPN8/RPN11